MRSIIIFALLALALCQYNPLLDINNRLGLTGDSQTENANTCWTGLFSQIQQFTPVIQDYQAEDLVALLADAATFVQQFEPTVQTACQAYAQDLENYAVTYGNGLDMRTNAYIYFPYVVKEVSVFVQLPILSNITVIGDTLGYIYQILVGATDLEVIAPTRPTFEQEDLMRQQITTLFTNEDNLNQYFQAFVESYGVADTVNVSSLVQLALNAKTFFYATKTFNQDLETEDYDGQITSIETYITILLEIARNNQEGLENIVTILSPALKDLESRPISLITSSLWSLAFYYPEALKLDIQMQEELLEGDFASLGTNAGQLAKIYYNQDLISVMKLLVE